MSKLAVVQKAGWRLNLNLQPQGKGMWIHSLRQELLWTGFSAVSLL